MDKFLIAPLKSGLVNDVQAWMIPDDAFYRLNNALVSRGQLKKRFGTKYTGTDSLTSRLRVYWSSTNGNGAGSGTFADYSVFKVGQEISIGTEVFRITVLGTNATMVSSGSGSYTLNTTTGAYTFSGCAISSGIYFYPCEPVMGLTQFEGDSVHNQMAIAFDTYFAYIYSANSWLRDGTSIKLTGDNSNLVRTCNWRGVFTSDVVLFATNAKDAIFYYEGSKSSPTWSSKQWNFRDDGTPTHFKLITAKAVLPFKGMLLAFAPTESDNTATPVNRIFNNRLRYTGKVNPLDDDAFMEVGQTDWIGGGYIDIGTSETFTGAYAFQDRIIVTFERSVWSVSYTGDEYSPFIWNRLNPELGSESPKAGVAFDREVLSVGSAGIWACNGINVERIDKDIPDQVFNLRISNNGLNQVAGIRDFENELVYWTWPTDDNTYVQNYPSKLLVYNYKNNTWSFYDDTYTAFGYFEQTTGKTWLDFTDPWYTYTDPWVSYASSSAQRFVIGGNQQGYVTILTMGESKCCANLNISGISYNSTTQAVTLTVKNHSMRENDFVRLDTVTGTTLSGIYQVTPTGDDTLVIYGILTNPGAYKNGGILARVPKIDILSKEWNPYKDKNIELNLAKISFGVKRQPEGEISVDYTVSHSDEPVLQNSEIKLGTNVLELTPYALKPIEKTQKLLWHSMNFNASGDSVQLRMFWSDDQMIQNNISEAGFQLEAMILYTQPSAEK